VLAKLSHTRVSLIDGSEISSKVSNTVWMWLIRFGSDSVSLQVTGLVCSEHRMASTCSGHIHFLP